MKANYRFGFMDVPDIPVKENFSFQCTPPIEAAIRTVSKQEQSLPYLYKRCSTGSPGARDLLPSSSTADKSLLPLLKLHSENKTHFKKITRMETRATAKFASFSVCNSGKL